jgi:hypothetical protein
MSGSAQDDWIRKVLGVAVGPPTGTVGKLLPIWTEAKDLVDAQIASIQQALRGSGDPVGKAIAERGLPEFTKNTLVPLTAALMEADAAGGEAVAPARKKAADRATELKQTLIEKHRARRDRVSVGEVARYFSGPSSARRVALRSASPAGQIRRRADRIRAGGPTPTSGSPA